MEGLGGGFWASAPVLRAMRRRCPAPPPQRSVQGAPSPGPAGLGWSLGQLARQAPNVRARLGPGGAPQKIMRVMRGLWARRGEPGPPDAHPAPSHNSKTRPPSLQRPAAGRSSAKGRGCGDDGAGSASHLLPGLLQGLLGAGVDRSALLSPTSRGLPEPGGNNLTPAAGPHTSKTRPTRLAQRFPPAGAHAQSGPSRRLWPVPALPKLCGTT